MAGAGRGRWLAALMLAVAVAGCGGRAQAPAPAARETSAPPPQSAPPSPSDPGAAPAPAASQPSAASTPAPAGPLTGELQTGQTYRVGASARNTNIELTVTDLQILSTAGSTAAQPGMQFIVLRTIWKNLVQPRTEQRPKAGGRTSIVGGGTQEMETVIVETPYLVKVLADNLYLVINGQHVSEVSAATTQLPGPLPLTGLLIEHYNDEVKGTVAFEIPAQTQSLALQFFDFAQGHITLPLVGAPPAGGRSPAAGPFRNQFFDAAVYRFEVTRKIGQAQAPPGRQFAIVEFGASSVVAGAATQLNFDQYASLIEDDVYHLAPVKDLPGVPFLFHGLVRFTPGLVRRGVIAFVVPEQPGRLELLLAASQMDPLSFVLTPDRRATAQPKSVRIIQDGQVAEIMINSARWSDVVDGMSAEAGRRFLVLDVTVWNREQRQGLIVQADQFVPTDGSTRFRPSGVTSRLAHPLVGERVVPAGRKARFEIGYEIPVELTSLRLRYQGFTKIEEVPLP